MSLKAETPERIGQRDPANIKQTRSHSPVFRKRIIALLFFALTGLLATLYNFARSKFVEAGSLGTWRWFWAVEVYIAVCLTIAVVQFLRKKQ